MSTVNESGYKTFQATAVAISKNTRVLLDSSGTISVAGATDDWIGTAVEDIAASGYGTIRLRNAPGSHFFVASAAVTRGAKLYPTADGKVDDAAGTGVFIGFEAAEAATADGDIIECVPSNSLVFTASADQAAVSAISGGESPTEAEHNALITLTLSLRTALINAGIIKGAA